MKSLLPLLIAFIFLGCEEPAPQLHILEGEALGTSYHVKFYGEVDSATVKFDSVINTINATFSTYIPNSRISKINHGDSTIVANAMFKEVMALSKTVYQNSGGYYDPTVGKLVNAYGFGPEGKIEELDSITVDSLKQFVGLDKVGISANGLVVKDIPGVYLDFNSIAKGYCIDRIGKMLEDNGVTDYLVELGGELLARGKNLDRDQAWAVGIENIDAPVDDRSYTRVVALQDMGMAGSGNYRKYRIDPATGNKYVHTINPLTGKAEKSDILSSTVIASTCAEADAYATTFMAMGIERSKKLLQKLEGVEAYLMYAEGNETNIYMTPGFKKYLKD
ncbi:MAG: thiamine biosynthesis protein ApbE [Cytophagaceae bacterium]|nr:thiamine biosynthesis protein ApbE [Cytophagaceae bacterium]|tara:strand:+ start:18587 stop:19588 length:1002 start_codon:yes stop_codon:yes gene_type:complete